MCHAQEGSLRGKGVNRSNGLKIKHWLSDNPLSKPPMNMAQAFGFGFDDDDIEHDEDEDTMVVREDGKPPDETRRTVIPTLHPLRELV